MVDNAGRVPIKRGRPKSTTSPFALKRAAREERVKQKKADYLMRANCTPTEKDTCRCGCHTGYTEEIIWLHRLYMAKRGDGELREWLVQRSHIDVDKLNSRENTNLHKVKLYTFSLEKPDVLFHRLQMLQQEGHSNKVLPPPSEARMQAVCSKWFFFMSTKSRNFFYPPNKRAKGNPKEARDRTFTLVAPSRRPAYIPREHRALSLCRSWIMEERGRHLIDPGGGGCMDQRTIVPYKDLLEAHAYFVIECEGCLMSQSDADKARKFYFQTDSALCAYGDYEGDGQDADRIIVHHENCIGGQAGCSCADDEEPVYQKDARYGNRLLGKLGALTTQADIPGYSYFTVLWKRPEFADVVLRKWMPFAACDVCVEHNDMRSRCLSEIERKALTAKYALHLDFVRRERNTYYHNADLAKRHPKVYLSLIIDGADTSKYHLPHTCRRSHLSDACKKVNIHLMGAISHGRNTFLWTVPPHLAQGHNVTIQAIHYILLQTKSSEGSLPKYLYLQLDNTTKQNKGRGLFAYLGLLLLFGVFERIFVNFLPVGHTHEDVDQIFSRISVYLRRHNALSLSQLHACLKKSVLKYNKRPIVGHWYGVMNISAYLKKYEQTADWTSDITLYYTFRIIRGTIGNSTGKVIVQARTFASSSEKAKDDCWRGFIPDTSWVFPFKHVTAHADLPNLHRDVSHNADSFKQAVPQHVTDADKDGMMSYDDVCSRQALSINHFMHHSKLFKEEDKAEMNKLLEALTQVAAPFSWNPDNIKYIYGLQPHLLDASRHRNNSPEVEHNVFNNNSGLSFPEPSESKEDSDEDFGAAHGGQNVVGFKRLARDKFYLVRSNVVTKFFIYKIKAIIHEDPADVKSKHVGAWAQQWNCGTDDCGNNPDKVDLVNHPWYPNARHIWSARVPYGETKFAKLSINECYDQVEMTKNVSSSVIAMIEKEGCVINGEKCVMKCITKATKRKAQHFADRLLEEASSDNQ